MPRRTAADCPNWCRAKGEQHKQMGRCQTCGSQASDYRIHEDHQCPHWRSSAPFRRASFETAGYAASSG